MYISTAVQTFSSPLLMTVQQTGTEALLEALRNPSQHIVPIIVLALAFVALVALAIYLVKKYCCTKKPAVRP